MILANKLRDVCDKLSTLIPELTKICVNNINNIPTQINRIVIGQDKLKIFLNRDIECEIDENDLKYASIIYSNMFRNCTSLTSVTIPDSVERIVMMAFYGCTSLTNMYLYPTTPPTLTDANAISTATTAIHVPIGSGEAYRTATNWSTFADIIVEDIEI